ncbi:2,3-diaminopropionate biosynthesis protein SbnA [Bacillus vallismortis]|uniref:2,3-diaminopropionate biosynthesis protein SbnA n=1 Tax=Bacillus vallismortis TaxID=72361 RepID=A0AAP3CFY0_BACVA|nr:2,3-diaminopropionate biosynthesis protein SbnA [Bacillus vallismortis]MCY8315852.1 2,3-diaminopropionate biosynthesis protein SbnA [Bacillus vallismortis]MEC1789993.1 2,3-diaminopropionate biosynthesis protein SbnA [Bacillus vallismortis]
MIYDNVLELIGNTPIVKLNNLVPSGKSELYAKLEGLNPGGSSKDRVASNLIEVAEKDGKLKKGGTIVESSSGNLAIGLSMVAKRKGYKMICIVDPKISEVNLSLIKGFGAQVYMVDHADKDGNYLKERLRKAEELSKTLPNCFWPNQYNNSANPGAYIESLAGEIYDDFKGDLDWIVCPVGTAGLITGLTKGLKRLIPRVKTLAVDAKGSVIFGGPSGKRHLIGMGNAIVPGNLEPELYDEVVHVGDEEAFYMTRQLALEEGLLVGGSSGASVFAATNLIQKLKEKVKILTLLPDRGDRYFNTIFSDQWIQNKNMDLDVIKFGQKTKLYNY